MSKRIEAKISCPNCKNEFDYTLYRTIWGEYPANRELVMSNRINVATCPKCKKETKLDFPFMYTNSKQQFAVWWEPEFDQQIGKDSESYVQMLGAGNYLATAPRVKDWNDFKDTIIKFEIGELKAKPTIVNLEMANPKQGFLNPLHEKNENKNGGCLGMTLILFVSCTSLIVNLIKKII